MLVPGSSVRFVIVTAFGSPGPNFTLIDDMHFLALHKALIPRPSPLNSMEAPR